MLCHALNPESLFRKEKRRRKRTIDVLFQAIHTHSLVRKYYDWVSFVVFSVHTKWCSCIKWWPSVKFIQISNVLNLSNLIIHTNFEFVIRNRSNELHRFFFHTRDKLLITRNFYPKYSLTKQYIVLTQCIYHSTNLYVATAATLNVYI